MHAYERTTPVYDYNVNLCGAVHITIGVRLLLQIALHHARYDTAVTGCFACLWVAWSSVRACSTVAVSSSNSTLSPNMQASDVCKLSCRMVVTQRACPS